MIVAIEGIDGSGKTTIASRLAQKLNMKYIKDPAKKVLNMSTAEYKQLFSDIEHVHGHATIAQLLTMGYTSLDKTENLICDRHILSNYFHNGNEETLPYFDAQVKSGDVPDLTFVLCCDKDERKRRIAERNPHDPDLQKDFDAQDARYDEMMAYADSRGIPCVEVSSEFIPLDVLVDGLAEVVLALQQSGPLDMAQKREFAGYADKYLLYKFEQHFAYDALTQYLIKELPEDDGTEKTK